MAPVATEVHEPEIRAEDHPVEAVKPAVVEPKDVLKSQIPATARARLDKAGIDYTKGYPYFPQAPVYRQEVDKIRSERKPYVDPGSRADPEKKALFSAAKEVRHLGYHLGTELVGLQLKDLTDQQRDELALLVAERTVVFIRDQDITPQQQRELGVYLGDGEIEIHPQAPQVPDVGGGVSLIWEPAAFSYKYASKQGRNFQNVYPTGQYGWHTDLVHEHFPPSYTHLVQDTVPEFGGDTLWASGYAAYDKLSPAFRKLLDGVNGVYISAHKYLDEENPTAPPDNLERLHPLIRTHPVTGWKSLFVNRSMTRRIDGFAKGESDAILNYLFDIYERNVDIQVRWSWTPNTSAIWDNRISIHTVSWDYEGNVERHGTRVTSLAEKPYFDPASKSRREALGLDK